MSLRDLIYIVNKRLFEKRNILLLIILSILLVIIYSSLTVIYFTQEVEKNYILNNTKYRELWVYNNEEDYKVLDNIPEIDYYVNFKFSRTLYSEVKEFDTDKAIGEIEIAPLIDNNDIKIITGSNIKNNNEMVCPKNFYPHSVYPDDFKAKIYYNKFLDGNKYINKSYLITPAFYEGIEEPKESVSIKIVGTYQSIKGSGTIQTCYVNKDTFDYLYTNISSVSGSTDIYGVTTYEPNTFQGVIARINSYENVEKVRNELIKSGYYINDMLTIDVELVNLLLNIPVFITIIILIIVINLVYSFINKKSKNRSNYLGILKFSGYTNRIINKLNMFENGIILFISIIISLVIYLILYVIISRYVLYDLIYNNYYIPLPIIYIVLLFIILYVIILFISYKTTKKALNKSIKTMLEENNDL
ncbi:MAG: hypothetical protein NC483_01675 [Ruminococcus sp.]|nr:hypothetical protein [Ruminococcus sp.]